MSIDLGYAPCRIADLEVGHRGRARPRELHQDHGGRRQRHGRRDSRGGRRRRHHAANPRAPRHPHAARHPSWHGGADEDRPGRPPSAASKSRPIWPGSSAGRFSKAAPILPVSNVTGEGFDPFLEALEGLVRAIPPQTGRRRLSPAAGPGVFGERLWDRRGRHSRSPARPRSATK